MSYDLKEFLKNAKKRTSDELSVVRADAHSCGKEPFDLKKLSSLFDASSEWSSDSELSGETKAELEYRYYMAYPAVLTLEEFARKLDLARML